MTGDRRKENRGERTLIEQTGSEREEQTLIEQTPEVSETSER
jgi:hypothetical protein